jgi:hypothetical protein
MPNLVHVATHPTRPLGRLPARAATHHPLVIPFETVKAAQPHLERAIADAPPPAFDYRDGLPLDTGALGNDRLGCCTAAAKGHRAQQFTSWRAMPPFPIAALQSCVERFYSETTGYDPHATPAADGTNPTDQGGDMQKIAEYLVETGFPMPDGTRDKLAFALQIDPAREADLAFCGLHCQGVDFGVVVTTSVMPEDGADPPHVWTTAPTDKPLGGHDVIAMGRRPNGNWLINSWGNFYEFDRSFLAANVELAFAYVGADMLRDGRTVMGLDLAAWQTVIATHGARA